MDVLPRRHGNVLVLSPQGRVDHVHAEAFKAAVDRHLAEVRDSGNPVVLDFSAVDYISSVGLRALMLVARQVKEQGGHIAIAALQPLVAEVFKISRFNLVYRVYQSVEEALQGIGGAD